MEPFELPADLTTLDDAELAGLLSAAVEAFDTLSTSTSLRAGDMDRMRSLSSDVRTIREEQAGRLAAAAEAAAEIDSLAAEIHGEEPAEPVAPVEPEPTALTEPVAVTEPVTPAEPAVPAQPELVTAAATTPPTRPALDLSGVRARQPRVLPGPPTPATRITAAVDVPGYRAGATMSLEDITPGAINRASALKASGGGTGLIASYHHPFPDDLIVNDPGSAPEGSTVSLRASQQNRLPQGDLVASGGWCAPSETLYNFINVACPDMLWDAPEIQLARGGLRYFKTPSLDVAAMTWVHTEADDIAGNAKPCFTIPCPAPVEVRCEAIGVCVEAGILTQRHFPELVSFYLDLTMIAHEIRVRQELLNAVAVSATPVAIAATFGALSPVFAAVALQAADMIERHSLCDSIALEVVFPWWSRNLFLADLARRNDVGIDQVTTADVQELFTPLGVRIQWARGITSDLPLGTPPVSNGIGGLTPALVWPDEVQFLIYPAGQIQIGRGAEVNLGVVHDSTKFSTNDYTASFSEECVTTVDRSVDTRLVTVPVCPSGETGAQTLLTCPAA